MRAERRSHDEVRGRIARVRRQARARGFTIAELLTVMAVIGILVAASAPSFISLMRDRRVNNAAEGIVDVYRTARARALGRGSAVVVRYDAGATDPASYGGQQDVGQFVVREAIVGPATPFNAQLPVSSCLGSNWNNGSTTSRHISRFDARRKAYQPNAVRFYSHLDPNSATEVPYSEICFTPRGRTFIRFAPNQAFEPLNGTPRVEVANVDASSGADLLRRQIIIMPNGAARLVQNVL